VAGELGDMTGQIAHPFDLLRRLNGADDQPQIPRHPSL
jgi:hypothetical protein